jgi:hypothetical protein
MFSGYGQSQAMTWKVFSELEKFMEEVLQRENALDSIHLWDQADVHRLVSAFLGVRFPIALALNKCDLPSSVRHVQEIKSSLPIHGAHVATPMAAKSEMSFVRYHLTAAVVTTQGPPPPMGINKGGPPVSVWQCLTSAMNLRAPILVFPVSDMVTYAPLPGMSKTAVSHPSLPSRGMVTCIMAAGGSPPSCWSDELGTYASSNKGRTTDRSTMLRDAILMKPGSTVDDVFLALKRLGALSGEFVRAEGAGKIGDKPKPVPKQDRVGKHNRILKIMSNKRTMWQS